jgi:hypothetical protein
MAFSMPPLTACTPSSVPMATWHSAGGRLALQALVSEPQGHVDTLGVVGAGRDQAQRQRGLRIVRMGLQPGGGQLFELGMALTVQQGAPLRIRQRLGLRLRGTRQHQGRHQAAPENGHSIPPWGWDRPEARRAV